MNKLDKDEDLSTQELETLGRAFRLMDKTIPNDQDSLERIQLYEAFSGIAPEEISENNERIEHHEKKISEYLARLEELNKEKNEMSSNDDSHQVQMILLMHQVQMMMGLMIFLLLLILMIFNFHIIIYLNKFISFIIITV
jgi:hypothetical protein